VRKLLNVLYITNPEAYLARDGENVVVRIDNEIKFRVPIHNLEGIVCFGYPGASPALLGLCTERGIALSFVTESGKFLARVTGRVNGNVLLRRRQYRIADNADESLKIARNFIFGKIFNCRCVLQRFLRDHGQDENIAVIEDKLKLLSLGLQEVENSGHIDELRGQEGDAARNYYAVFDWMILEQKEVFRFSGRSRRPPLDPMNAVLSFLYMLLAHDCAAALETVGLDPQVGFLHCERPGRPSLALDMMEELRPYLVDRLALSLVNNRQLSPKGFEIKESGGVLMDEETRKTVITAWQKRKQEEITHPFLKEKIPAGLIPYAQSLLLARHLRGDLEAYPPFLVK
jgi:CRISPR-associated protein Cas1